MKFVFCMFFWHVGIFPLCHVANLWFCWCWARPRLLFCFCFLRRNANLAGEFVGRLRCCVFVLLFSSVLLICLCCFNWNHCVSLRVFNSFDMFTPISGPSLGATSAEPEEKNASSSSDSGHSDSSSGSSEPSLLLSLPRQLRLRWLMKLWGLCIAIHGMSCFLNLCVVTKKSFRQHAAAISRLANFWQCRSCNWVERRACGHPGCRKGWTSVGA